MQPPNPLKTSFSRVTAATKTVLASKGMPTVGFDTKKIVKRYLYI